MPTTPAIENSKPAPTLRPKRRERAGERDAHVAVDPEPAGVPDAWLEPQTAAEEVLIARASARWQVPGLVRRLDHERPKRTHAESKRSLRAELLMKRCDLVVREHPADAAFGSSGQVGPCVGASRARRAESCDGHEADEQDRWPVRAGEARYVGHLHDPETLPERRGEVKGDSSGEQRAAPCIQGNAHASGRDAEFSGTRWSSQHQCALEACECLGARLLTIVADHRDDADDRRSGADHALAARDLIANLDHALCGRLPAKLPTPCDVTRQPSSRRACCGSPSPPSTPSITARSEPSAGMACAISSTSKYTSPSACV